jgi:hypothetical protein
MRRCTRRIGRNLDLKVGSRVSGSPNLRDGRCIDEANKDRVRWADGRSSTLASSSERYPMTSLQGGGYRQRTVNNVLDSDGTAILFYESLTGGTLYTHDVCRREHKPYIVLDSTRISESGAAAAIMRFVNEREVQVLNVAGPRLSKWTEGYAFALAVVGEVIKRGRAP